MLFSIIIPVYNTEKLSEAMFAKRFATNLSGTMKLF